MPESAAEFGRLNQWHPSTRRRPFPPGAGSTRAGLDGRTGLLSHGLPNRQGRRHPAPHQPALPHAVLANPLDAEGPLRNAQIQARHAEPAASGVSFSFCSITPIPSSSITSAAISQIRSSRTVVVRGRVILGNRADIGTTWETGLFSAGKRGGFVAFGVAENDPADVHALTHVSAPCAERQQPLKLFGRGHAVSVCCRFLTILPSGTAITSIVGHDPSGWAMLIPSSSSSTTCQPRTAHQNSATTRGRTASICDDS